MKDRFESLESGEVISVQQDTPVLIGQRTFRVGELNDAIKQQLANAIEGWSEEKSAWFSPNGIQCEALRFGANDWQKGRIRLFLEFCPDEPSMSAESVINNSLPTGNTVTPQSNVAVLTAPTEDNNLEANVLKSIAAPTTVATEPNSPSVDVPLAGIAVGTVGVGAAILNGNCPDLADLPVDRTPTSEPVSAQQEAPSIQTPPLTEAILVTEEDSGDRHSEGLDEISFEFAGNNGDRQGTIVADGMMELDLSDLDLDRAEHDYLNFETSNISDASPELINFQDLSNGENSGMLIDEVWNEINQQPSWPGIH